MFRFIPSTLCAMLFAFLTLSHPVGAQAVGTFGPGAVGTSGPGDGCAPDTHGRLNTQCLTVFAQPVILMGETTGWIALDRPDLTPAETPLSVLLPLMSTTLGSGFAVQEELTLSSSGPDVVDFLLRNDPRRPGGGTRTEWAGRLVRGEDGLWALQQLDQRTTCIAVGRFHSRCP